MEFHDIVHALRTIIIVPILKVGEERQSPNFIFPVKLSPSLILIMREQFLVVKDLK